MASMLLPTIPAASLATSAAVAFIQRDVHAYISDIDLFIITIHDLGATSIVLWVCLSEVCLIF